MPKYLDCVKSRKSFSVPATKTKTVGFPASGNIKVNVEVSFISETKQKIIVLFTPYYRGNQQANPCNGYYDNPISDNVLLEKILKDIEDGSAFI